MSNPFFLIGQGATTPTLDVACLDDDGVLVNLVGASCTFTLYELGGAEIFTRAGTVVSPSTGHVRYSWQAGDTAELGRYLGRFEVTYSSLETQEFPPDRYIRVTVEE